MLDSEYPLAVNGDLSLTIEKNLPNHQSNNYINYHQMYHFNDKTQI